MLVGKLVWAHVLDHHVDPTTRSDLADAT